MKSIKFLAMAAVAISFCVKDVQAGCGTCDKTIVENAINIDGFKTLVAAVKAADLVDTLSGEGPFTVFAPTDDAFAKLPEGTLEDLLKPENKDKLIANPQVPRRSGCRHGEGRCESQEGEDSPRSEHSDQGRRWKGQGEPGERGQDRR